MSTSSPGPKPLVKAIAAFAFAAVLGGCVSSAGKTRSEGARALESKPDLEPLRSFSAALPVRERFGNGIELVVAERPNSKLVALRFVSKLGATEDPAGKAGIGSLMAELLPAGAGARNALEVAKEAAFMGAEIEHQVTRDFLSISLVVLPEHLTRALQLLADVVARPKLDAQEFERLRTERATQLLSMQDDPSYLAEVVFDAAVYGKHPYGRPVLGERESVAELRWEDANAQYQRLKQSPAAWVVAGPVKASQVREQLEKALSSWSTTFSPSGAPSAPAPQKSRLLLVDRPDSTQSVLRVGEPAVPRTHPNFFPLRVGNKVLGESFMSRLNDNLRERNGYSYGARSRFSFLAGAGPFYAESAVKADVTLPGLKEMLFEIERFATKPLNPPELEKGKALVASDLISTLQSSESAALSYAALWAQGVSLDVFGTWVERLKKVTAEDVQKAIQETVHPGSQVIVVVGDAKMVEPDLKKLGMGNPERYAIEN